VWIAFRLDWCGSVIFIILVIRPSHVQITILIVGNSFTRVIELIVGI
jgi:hypothetical protein